MTENRHNPKNDLSFTEAEKELRERFRQAESAVPSPSPFLKTRVLALYRERKQNRRKIFFWKLVAFAGTAFGMAAIALIFVLQGLLPSPQSGSQVAPVRALVGQPMAIQLKSAHLEANGNGLVHRVEVSLSEGIRFYSPNHPEVSRIKRIVLDVNRLAGRSEFPIVIRSDSAGVKIITIRFLNEKGQVLKERNLETTFYTRVG